MSIAMEDWPRRHRITVDEYHRMAEVGALAPDARVELIEGVIIDMPPMGSRHASTVNRLNELLQRAVGDRAIVNGQTPITLGDLSEPQPDIALVVRRPDFYEHQLPTAADILLLVEISEATLRYDLRTKMPLYARHGVPELWILDTEAKQLRVFRNVVGGAYGEVLPPQSPGVMTIASLPGVTIDLSLSR